jgi:hypothetical protein
MPAPSSVTLRRLSLESNSVFRRAMLEYSIALISKDTAPSSVQLMRAVQTNRRCEAPMRWRKRIVRLRAAPPVAALLNWMGRYRRHTQPDCFRCTVRVIPNLIGTCRRYQGSALNKPIESLVCVNRDRSVGVRAVNENDVLLQSGERPFAAQRYERLTNTSSPAATWRAGSNGAPCRNWECGRAPESDARDLRTELSSCRRRARVRIPISTRYRSQTSTVGGCPTAESVAGRWAFPRAQRIVTKRMSWTALMELASGVPTLPVGDSNTDHLRAPRGDIARGAIEETSCKSILLSATL